MAPARTIGAIIVANAAASVFKAVFSYFLFFKKTTSTLHSNKKKKPRNGVVDANGNNPLIRINSLSEATGYSCQVLWNQLNLAAGGVVTGGSAGTTAISLATAAPVYGCKCHVVIPDDVAIEKEKETPDFFSHCRSGFFADQSENLANFRAQYEGTGPEIWEQTGSSLDAFVAAAGTGGTVAGVFQFLKRPKIKCFLIDPPGSGLFNKVTRGVMYTKEEAEGRRLKNPFDTITEETGINRSAQNFMMAKLDGAFRVTDKEAVEMLRFLLMNDGLFPTSSSAINSVGAVRVTKALGLGHTIITILCDSGMRDLSKFYEAK